MQQASILQDELLRLNDLLSHHILDSGEEESFNELLDIAAHICGCPTALISIVDKDRQWFKSKINLEQNELPRDSSFCGHAIVQNDVFIVEDASTDERFFDNPNVTGDLSIRFYAGAQIVSKSGFNLGTVCVIDSQPRSISEDQMNSLRKVASQVSKMIELKKQQFQSMQSIKRLKKDNNFEALFMQSSFPKIIFAAGGYNIIDANEAALKLYGYEREEFLQLTALDIRANKSKELMQRRVNKVENSNNPVTLSATHIRKDSKVISVTLTFSTIVYNGEPARLADIVDITSQKNLAEKRKDDKLDAEKKLLETAIWVKQKEKDSITDALRENINQVLACTNLYLSIASEDEHMRLELIEKSKKNVLLAMAEIKKLYKSSHELSESSYLQQGIEQLILKYELLSSFNIHFVSEGDENILPDEMKTTIFKIIDEYFDIAFKKASLKNIWLTINYGTVIQVIIKNDNSQPDSKKRRQYMQKLNADLEKINGAAQLFECADISCTLQVMIPNGTSEENIESEIEAGIVMD